jgi:anionic cell wall polymer biosynthesis LytR-Cps2A-Psr (LCP) family protein
MGLLAVIVIITILIGVSTGTRAAAVLRAQPGSLRWDERSPMNVLLLGVQGDAGATVPADPILVASIDPVHHTMGLLALPANLWVDVPGYGQSRLGDAYADGGPHLAVQTVEGLLGVPVPYYVAAGYNAFRRIVDAYGGLPPRMAGLHSRQGGKTASGAAVLSYVESPRASEETRASREVDVFLALMRQSIRPQNFFRIPGLVSTLGGSVATNVPYDQAFDLAHVLGAIPPANVRSLVIGENTSTATPYSGSGTSVLMPDTQRITSAARSLLRAPGLLPTESVAVLNGSGELGQASDLATWLRSLGLKVRHVGEAQSYSYGQTQVVVGRSAPAATRAFADELAAILRIPERRGAGGRVSVIIGHDYVQLSQP